MTTPALATHLRALMLRDLRAVRREIEAYPNDQSVWALPSGISNSSGTLVLHLAGNLRLYVGHVMGGIAYERDRPREFAARDLSREELFAELDAAIDAVDRGMRQLRDEQLTEIFPLPVGNFRVNTQEFLTHCATHLAYHLGQVDYHRRLTTGSPVTVSTVALADLSSAQ